MTLELASFFKVDACSGGKHSSDWPATGGLTFGRQYDLIGDIFPAFAVGSNTPAGLLA
ncbi:MAG: hypothetical protein PPHEINF_6233 [uncultured Paraburkholderia sp.]|nr:MAG: hypothetical protein PPHEINF_6233 [uncultured Paraburkholderia sp.]CAH2945171.1 MAG: hypothetical protein PPHEMADMSA_6234 [uncultured Paraburkholderia sp.]